MTFKSKILNREQWWAEYLSFTVPNLISPAIIKSYENIRKYVTYVTEFMPYAPIGDDLMPSFSKAVSFTFRKDVLTTNAKDVSADIKNMLLKVQEEVALVEQDNLAKGDLIETARTSAQLKESGDTKAWVANSDSLKCPFREDDPAEYWGDVGLYHSDFIAGTSKYPWMPSSISEKEGPFD